MFDEIHLVCLCTTKGLVWIEFPNQAWCAIYGGINGEMVDTGIRAENDAQYQAYGGKLYKVKGDSITEVP